MPVDHHDEVPELCGGFEDLGDSLELGEFGNTPAEMLLFGVDGLAGEKVLGLFEDELFEEFVVVLGLFADGELF